MNYSWKSFEFYSFFFILTTVEIVILYYTSISFTVLHNILDRSVERFHFSDVLMTLVREIVRQNKQDQKCLGSNPMYFPCDWLWWMRTVSDNINSVFYKKWIRRTDKNYKSQYSRYFSILQLWDFSLLWYFS